MRHFTSPEIGMFGRRQRHVRGHRIPVTIAPKGKANADCTVVVDTFGANDIAPLPGGCTCCSARVKLQCELRRLLGERDQKPFSRFAIVSNEDLRPILHTFVTERALAAEFYVEDAPSLDGDCFTIAKDAPISWDGFSRFAMTVAALRGPDLLQMNGLLNVAGCRGPVAVQLMGHLSARPIELLDWPNGDRASRMELVTRGIEEKSVRDLFNSVLALA